MGTADPHEAIREHLCRPPGERRVVRASPGQVGTVLVGGGPFQSADPSTLVCLKHRSIDGRQVHAVTYMDAEGHDHLDLVGLLQQPDGTWRPGGGAGGSGTGPPRERPWLNACGWHGGDGFSGGGRVIGTDAERAAAVRLRFADGTLLEDTVEAGLVLFITDHPVEWPANVEILDSGGSLLAEHAAFEVPGLR